MKKTTYCRGCRDDFYNDNNPLGIKRCWYLKAARVVKRWRIGWWTRPSEPRAFTEVKTYHCHNEPGRFAFEKELPEFAVKPVRIQRAPRRKSADSAPAAEERER